MFVTDFIQHSVLDWDMQTERWGVTDSSGKVSVLGLSNRNDSIRIKEDKYLSVSVVLNDENELIFVYRTSQEGELVHSHKIPFGKFETIPMILK